MNQTHENELRAYSQNVVIDRLTSSRSAAEVTNELKGLSEVEQLEALQKAIYATEDEVEMYLSWNMPALASSKTSLLTCLQDTLALVRSTYTSSHANFN